MPAAYHFQDQAYVLHSRAYRNTSLIVDVLTREYGRLSLVAKGAKRGSAPLAGRLQPYLPLFLEWGGQGELQTLYKAEADSRSYQSLSGDALYHGFYLNELLLRLLHRHDPHPALFDDYAQCLHDLVRAEHKDISLRYFELHLLESLGYAMNLTLDVHTETDIEPHLDYYYVIEQGPVRVSGQTHETVCVSGETLFALAEHSLASDKQRHEARLLLRSVLNHYLGERPLKTRELMQSRKLLRSSTPKPG
jgi:DNA repair protein RecO (recombination protein O)